MEWWQLLIYGIASFLSSIMSGISGGGGGFIMTPLSIFLGLTPAQAVATGKINGLSVTLGSLSGLKKAKGKVAWRRIIPIMILALLIGLLAPFAIKYLDSAAYQLALGVIVLLMIPVVIIKKVGQRASNPSMAKQAAGGGLLALALALQGIFSGGLGTLVSLVLMGMLGMTALEANITKRWSQLVLNVAIIIGVFGSGLIIWQVAAVGVFTTFIGGYIGGNMAVQKGDGFIMKVMLAAMFISGCALIIEAIV